MRSRPVSCEEVQSPSASPRNVTPAESLAERKKVEKFLVKYSNDTVYGKKQEDPSKSAASEGETDRESRVVNIAQMAAWRRGVTFFLKRNWARSRFEVGPGKRLPFGVLLPQGQFRQIWDMVAIVLVLILGVSLPYRLAFTEGNDAVSLTVFDVCIDFFFLADIVVNSTTAFYLDDHLIYKRHEILWNYLRTWLIIDIVASLPLEWILFGFPPPTDVSSSSRSSQFNASALGAAAVGTADISTALQTSQLLKTIKITKLLKLFRVGRLLRYYGNFEALVVLYLNMSYNLLRLPRLLFLIVLLCHWNACIQYLMAVVDNFPEDSWPVRAGFVLTGGQPAPFAEDVSVRYSYAFLSSFMQILAISEGLEDPVRQVEVWIGIAAMMIGVAMQAIFVASLTVIYTGLDASGQHYHHNLDMLNQYMRHARLPRQTRTKLRHFYELLYPGQRAFDERRILDNLSRSLLEEVTQHMCRPVLAALSVVDGAEPGLAGALSREMHRTVYVAGDYIIREGEPASTMYFIEQGEVVVLSSAQGAQLTQDVHDQAGVVATLGRGAFFGEMSLISESGRTLASVRVTQACVAMYLDREAYNRVCAQYPTFARYVEAVVRLRLQTTVKHKRMQQDSGEAHVGFDEMSVQEILQDAEGNIVNRAARRPRPKQRGSVFVTAMNLGQNLLRKRNSCDEGSGAQRASKSSNRSSTVRMSSSVDLGEPNEAPVASAPADAAPLQA